MKKVLFLSLLLLLSFSIYTNAENDDEISDGAFSIASYHSTLNLVKDEAGLEKLYTSIDWLIGQKDELDIRMVSFIGNLTNGSVTQYKDYVTNGGHTSQEYISYCLDEENWVKEWDAIAGAVHYTSGSGIPVSVAAGKKEYPGRGFSRNNLLSDYFILNDLYDGSNGFDYYDDANHYYCFHAEGYKYMVVTLEVYPREGVLLWLDEVMKKKSDYKTMLSSEGGDPITLISFDETKPLTGQAMKNSFLSSVGDNLALKVKVKGNNSSDAICIRINSSIDYTPLSDYRIDLDFEGEREFILAEVDNSPALDSGFTGKTSKGWNYYRMETDYTKITTVEVYLKGECKDVVMSSITATDYIKNKLINPQIKVNGQSITFECELMSTEYLEYTSGDTAAVYDEFGNSRSVSVKGGMPTVNSGENSITLSAESTRSTGRAKLTLGFIGEELK